MSLPTLSIDDWTTARATGRSPYLERLGLAGDNALRYRRDGALVVPVFEVAGRDLAIAGAVDVDAQGRHEAPVAGERSGLFLGLGKWRRGRLLFLAEDLASALALRAATKYRFLVLVPAAGRELVEGYREAAAIAGPAGVIVFANAHLGADGEEHATARVEALQAAGASRVACLPPGLDCASHGRTYLAWRQQVGAEAFAAAIGSLLPTGPEEKDAGPRVPDTAAGPAIEVPAAEAWAAELQLTDSGRPRPSTMNAFLYLKHHADWQGVLAYDLFADAVVKAQPPPFDGGAAGEWTELDDARLLLWLSPRIGELSADGISRAVTLAAHEHAFNPMVDYLGTCAADWDRVPRVAAWLFDYLGAGAEARQVIARAQAGKAVSQEEPARLLVAYLERVGTKWLIGAVARAFEPGCRVDNMLILEGAQGTQKSTALSVLGGEWFTDAALDFANRDSLLILQGRWIIEMAELEGMNKAEASQTKKFLTQHTDLFRPPYGRKLVKRPRRCVFAGSVNLDQYLKDESGNRRFWPVRVGAMDIAGLRRDVRQLWGEAVHLYRNGVPWWVLPDERALFTEQQDERFSTDPWQSDVSDYLDGEGAFIAADRRDRATVPEILGNALKLDKARWDRQAALRVNGIFRCLRWERKRESNPPRAWFYMRPGSAFIGANARGKGGNEPI